MSLIISGKPFIKGSIKAKVPTETYSGEGDPASSGSTNPYTGLSPVVPVITIFNYTGILQHLLLPNNAKSVSIVMWGAGGAGTSTNNVPGGPGGFSSGGFTVTGGETLDIIVGGAGISGALSTTNPAPGGFGGGANGGSGSSASAGGGSGGGRSSVGVNNATEIITAGGGGGGGSGGGAGHYGGIGGGLSGGDGFPISTTYGLGGKQLAFTTGFGTAGQSDGYGTGSGGGGGGWNGGNGGRSNISSNGSAASGGGGSAHGEPVISNFVTIVGTSNVVAAPQNTHADYITGVGKAGNGLLPGGNGLVIVRYMS